MSKKKRRIRPLVLVITRRDSDGGYLLMEGYDRVKEEHFLRPLGGGIEFDETGEVAIRREMMEEIDAELVDLRFVKVFENIFVLDGKPGHEIILMYRADLADESQYEVERFEFSDGKNNEDRVTAVWRTVEFIRAHPEVPLYPEGLIDLLESSQGD